MKSFMVFVVLLSLAGLCLASPSSAQDVQALVKRGVENCNDGKFDQAINVFNQALQTKPNNSEVLSYRGLAYYAKGRSDQAIKDFNQAIQADPKYAKAYWHRAKVLFDNGQPQKAVEDLDKAQSLGMKVDEEFYKLVKKKAAEKK